jgi:NAD(P)-dependent dehydrogenase (short-subunit alcohol dehydrogenase family)
MGRLECKGVLVTGGSRGIGAAIARRLAHEGARVIVNFQISRREAEQVVADIAGAFALAGCCVSGHGCYVPIPATPFALSRQASLAVRAGECPRHGW